MIPVNHLPLDLSLLDAKGSGNMVSSGPTVDFLKRLKRLDAEYVTPRDVLCLYCVLRKPGMSRQDLCHVIGVLNASNVLSNVTRLIRWGFMEDRRVDIRRASPSMLYVLPPGIEFWNSIDPGHLDL